MIEAVGIGVEQWDETRDARWTGLLDDYLAGLGLAPRDATAASFRAPSASASAPCVFARVQTGGEKQSSR